MAKKFTFTNCYARHGALAISTKDGAGTRRVDLTMGWTQKVRDSLGWSDLDETQEHAHLKGSMNVMSILLEVGGKSFDLGSGVMKNFHVVRVENKTELRCQFVTNMHGIMGKVESYVESTSRAKGDLKVTYDWVDESDGEAEEQETLDGMEE